MKNKKRANRMRSTAKRRKLKASGMSTCYLAATSVSIKVADEANKVPRFEFSPAYSGGKLPVSNFDHPVVIDLSTLTIPATIKANYEHDSGLIVGHTELAEIRAHAIYMAGILSRENETRDRLVAESKNGFPWEASIEAEFPKPKLIKRGQKLQANGRLLDGPFYFARNAAITGVAFTDHGADRSTAVSIAAKHKEKGTMSQALDSFLQDNDLDVESVTLEQIQAAISKGKPKPAPKAKDQVDPDESGKNKDDWLTKQRLAASAEFDRTDSIRTVCEEFGEPTIEVDGDNNKPTKISLAAHATREGWDVEKTKLHARLWKAEKSSGGAHGPSIQDRSRKYDDIEMNAIQASLAVHQFQRKAETAAKWFGEDAVDLGLSARYRGFGLQETMQYVITAAGVPFSGPRKSNGFIRAAFKATQMLESQRDESGHIQASSAGVSTMGLRDIFENLMNKVLLDSFMHTAVTWREIAKKTTVSDFKAHTRYRMTETGGFQKLGTAGEIKHMGLAESKRSVSAETWAVMIMFTRKMIIDDDMSALAPMPGRLGRMGTLKIEEEIYRHVLAGIAAFQPGGLRTEALDATNLGLVRDDFMNRVDSNNKPITTTPAILLHGIPLTTMANNLFREETVPIPASDYAGEPVDKRRFSNNEHFGLYRPVGTPYLSNTAIRDQSGVAIPNQSDTQWALLTEPTTDLALVEVAFLDGVESPYVETGELDFEKLGFGYRSYFDFGVEFADEESVLWSDGTVA